MQREMRAADRERDRERQRERQKSPWRDALSVSHHPPPLAVSPPVSSPPGTAHPYTPAEVLFHSAPPPTGRALSMNTIALYDFSVSKLQRALQLTRDVREISAFNALHFTAHNKTEIGSPDKQRQRQRRPSAAEREQEFERKKKERKRILIRSRSRGSRSQKRSLSRSRSERDTERDTEREVVLQSAESGILSAFALQNTGENEGGQENVDTGPEEGRVRFTVRLGFCSMFS